MYGFAQAPRLLDRWLDKVVEVSGSEFVYFTIIVALLVWAFLGIPFGRSNISRSLSPMLKPLSI